MSKIICPNCDALTSLPWPRKEGGVFSLSKPSCPLCKEAIANDLYVALKIESEQDQTGANPIPAEQGQTADLTGIQFNVPKASNWATLYRVCGWLLLVLGIIGTIGTAQENEEAGFTFAVIAIALVLTCFLSAFLIDVLTDMRHYQKQSAECLQKLLEKG